MMLRVTVEIVPWGVESDKYEVGVLEIANDGSGTLEKGSYFVKSFSTNGTNELPVAKLGRTYGIKHVRLSGFWPLVHKVLEGLLAQPGVLR